MHRIGQRIIKTSIAVFIAISIHIILLYIDKHLADSDLSIKMFSEKLKDKEEPKV